LLETCRGTQ